MRRIRFAVAAVAIGVLTLVPAAPTASAARGEPKFCDKTGVCPSPNPGIAKRCGCPLP